MDDVNRSGGVSLNRVRPSVRKSPDHGYKMADDARMTRDAKFNENPVAFLPPNVAERAFGKEPVENSNDLNCSSRGCGNVCAAHAGRCGCTCAPLPAAGKANRGR